MCRCYTNMGGCLRSIREAKMKRFAYAIFVISLLAGCALTTVRGSGRITTITKYYQDYHGIRLSGTGIVHLVQSPNYRFSATADDNILRITDVVINDGILEISYLKDFQSTKIPEFVIEAPDFRSIALDGRARLISDNVLSASRLELSMNGAAQCRLNLAVRECDVRSRGASELELAGTGTRLTVKSLGASQIRAFEYSVQKVELELSGAGRTEVYAAENLDVTLHGSAEVLYTGKPHIRTDITGSGSIHPVDYTPRNVYVQDDAADGRKTMQQDTDDTKAEDAEDSADAKDGHE